MTQQVNQDQTNDGTTAELKQPTSGTAAADIETMVNSELWQAKLEQMTNELRDANDKAAQHWDAVLRTKAEIENVRRRAALDVEKAHKFGIEGLAKELIQVVDSLDKGLEQAAIVADNEQIVAMKQGLELTHKLLVDSLAKFGIQEINPLGEIFDPAKHEALSMQENPAVADYSVLLVVQKGFLIHDRILRPARVIVAKPSGNTTKVDNRA